MMRPATAPGKTHRPRSVETGRAGRAGGSARGTVARTTGPDLAHERRLWRAGHELVAGMDEVGRGAWAGPLTVGVAVMTRGIRRIPRGLRDSKQLAEAVRRSCTRLSESGALRGLSVMPLPRSATPSG